MWLGLAIHDGLDTGTEIRIFVVGVVSKEPAAPGLALLVIGV